MSGRLSWVPQPVVATVLRSDFFGTALLCHSVQRVSEASEVDAAASRISSRSLDAADAVVRLDAENLDDALVLVCHPEIGPYDCDAGAAVVENVLGGDAADELSC